MKSYFPSEHKKAGVNVMVVRHVMQSIINKGGGWLEIGEGKLKREIPAPHFLL